jgi:hypothetical protein
MGLDDLRDTKIEQTFQQLISSVSAILRVEQGKEAQRLENSFIHLISKTKVFLDRELRSELEKCSKFLETAKSVLHQDILNRATRLDALLKRARPVYERINIFSILNITRQENPQSYFLAWLLNPNNPHGFGDRILRAFLKKDCDIVREFEYESLKITDVTVTTQQSIEDAGVPDIEIVGNNFICVIENKVGAGETLKGGIPQTKLYADYYDKEAEKDHKLLLYLVPPSRYEGEIAKQPSDKRFKQMLYSDIVKIIESVLRTSNPLPKVNGLIEMFLHNIKKEICHEFDEYFEAEKLLDGSRYNPSYFARPDRYESLRRLIGKLSKEVMKNEPGKEAF